MKVAIVTDSNSGITQSEAKELGISVVPMPFMINEKDYFEDINLTQKEFYDLISDGSVVLTSQPSVGYITELWKNLLQDYDEIVYIPMSSGLSQSCQTAMFLANDFDGKVMVVNNQRISDTQRYSVYDAMELAKRGKSAKEIKDILEAVKMHASIYITVDSLKYLRRGGRITAKAALLGKLLKIKPVLQIQGEKLDAYEKARGMKIAKRIMLEAMQKDIEERFNGIENVHLSVIYSENRNDALEYLEAVKSVFPNIEINVAPLSLSVACHIGPGSIALTCSEKIDFEKC